MMDAVEIGVVQEARRFIETAVVDPKVVDHIVALLAVIEMMNLRLIKYACDLEDATKVLGWAGIPMPDDTSVADGINALYERFTKVTDA